MSAAGGGATDATDAGQLLLRWALKKVEGPESPLLRLSHHFAQDDIELISILKNTKEWNLDDLCMVSGIYYVAKEKIAEEKLGRLLKRLAEEIVKEVRVKVKEGRTRVRGTLEFEKEDACMFRAINMQSRSTHALMSEDSKEYHNGILMRLESLLPEGMRSDDIARFNNWGLRVWFFFEPPGCWESDLSSASAHIDYQLDWGGTFDNDVKIVKNKFAENLAQKKRAHEGASQYPKKRAKNVTRWQEAKRSVKGWTENAEIKLAELIWNDPDVEGQLNWTQITTDFNEWAKSVGELERERDALQEYAVSKANEDDEDDEDDKTD